MALSNAVSCVVILLTVNLLTSVNCQVPELSVYKADSKSDMKKLGDWFSAMERVKSKGLMKDNKAAMYNLKKESCKNDNDRSLVCNAFRNAEKKEKRWAEICPKLGLWIAECYALFMETDSAHKEFNAAAMREDFETYEVVNYLLNCAVIKLSLKEEYKVNDNEKLYRCLKTKHKRPNANRIFGKTFTATSLHETCEFGSETLIEFEPKATKFGAKIKSFSMHPHQEEVLIPPFESFDVLESEAKNPEKIRFKSSQEQKYESQLYSICRN